MREGIIVTVCIGFVLLLFLNQGQDTPKDCAGVPGGSAVEEIYYLDIDGDGFGAGDGYRL